MSSDKREKAEVGCWIGASKMVEKSSRKGAEDLGKIKSVHLVLNMFIFIRALVTHSQKQHTSRVSPESLQDHFIHFAL